MLVTLYGPMAEIADRIGVDGVNVIIGLAAGLTIDEISEAIEAAHCARMESRSKEESARLWARLEKKHEDDREYSFKLPPPKHEGMD